VQGFRPDDGVDSKDTVALGNVEGHSEAGARSLAIRYSHVAPGRVAPFRLLDESPDEAVQVVLEF